MTYKDQIMDRIDNLSSKEVFIANDFFDIAGYETIRSTLNRLVEDEEISRIMNGIYYKPKFIELIGEYEAPSVNEVANAIARKYNWTIAPSGNTALNLLGLSTQVPAKWTYISDGRYVDFKFGNTTIEFKRRNNGDISKMSTLTAMVIQAIKAIGKDKITDEQIDYLREKFSLPIIGIVEAGVKIASKTTKNKNIAVISTKFTAESHGYKNKAKMLDSELNVKEIACIEFAQMIESGWDTFDNRKELLNKYLSEIPKNTDTLVLGCTHYPLIRKDIEKNIKIKVVDPAVEIVERATQTLSSLNLLNDKKEKGRIIFFVTGETYHFKPTAEKFLGKEIEIYRIPK